MPRKTVFRPNTYGLSAKKAFALRLGSWVWRDGRCISTCFPAVDLNRSARRILRDIVRVRLDGRERRRIHNIGVAGVSVRNDVAAAADQALVGFETTC
jgi:hypothetical protein